MKVRDKNVKTYNYSKLKARTVEMGLLSREVAAAINMSAPTYSMKLNGKAEFSQNEIRKICEFLKIEASDIPLYFFANQV